MRRAGRNLRRGDELDDDTLTRVSTFMETDDVRALREEWGDEAFEKVVAYVWEDIPLLILRLSVLGDRDAAKWTSDADM